MTMIEAADPTFQRGYAVSRLNAARHGVLSRFALLPWEDPAEHDALLAEFLAEHQPHGPTERHLVEELAGVVWRKRRLRLAEAAAHRAGLHGVLTGPSWVPGPIDRALAHLDTAGGDAGADAAEAVRAAPGDAAREAHDLDADEALTRRALRLLALDKPDAYVRALKALREDTRGWWQEVLEDQDAASPTDDDGEEPYRSDAADLRRFLEAEVLPWYGRRRAELARRPLVVTQVHGKSLNAEKLLTLARYEAHLDRKLERTLAMLLKLRDLRPAEAPEQSVS